MVNRYLVGEKYGELTIIGDTCVKRICRAVKVKCECGHVKVRSTSGISQDMKHGLTSYCGRYMQHKRLTGQDIKNRYKYKKEKVLEVDCHRYSFTIVDKLMIGFILLTFVVFISLIIGK